MIRGKFRKGMLGIAFVGAAVLAAVLSACNATIPNPNSAVEFKPTGTIQGVLRDAVTNEPIAGAKIDIGVASTTTTADGQFVITNVPATQENTIVGGGPVTLTHGAYRVTVVMAGVTSPAAVCATGGNAAGTLCYAPFYLLGTVAVNYSQLNEGATATTSTTATNHNTQVTGLVSTVDWKVGKLSGVINGTVANNKTNINVGAGYTVQLVANDSVGTTANIIPGGADNGTSGTVGTQMAGAGAGNGNMGAGFAGNLVATTTTDASGKFSFKGIEAGRKFLMTASSADGNYATVISYPITAPGDNNPNNWYNNPEATVNAANFTASAQGVFATGAAGSTGVTNAAGVFPNHHALYVAPTDTVGPIVLSVSPGNGSDNAPSDPQVVTITFKEAIKQNSYSCGGPSTCTASGTGAPTGAAFEVLAPGGTVYNNNVTGNTGIAIATLFTDTVVSGATKGGIAKSMFWSADMMTLYISFSTGKSMFYTVNFAAPAAQLKDAYGTKITDPGSALVANGWNGAVAVATPWTLHFTTNGGNLITAAPTVFVPDLSGLDYTGGGTITWNPVAGAVGYNVYCQEIYIWQDGTGGTPTTPATAQAAATLLINGAALVNSTMPVTTATQAFRNPSRDGAAGAGAGKGFNTDLAGTSGTSNENLFLLGNVGVQYSCTVKGVNSDRTEGPASTAVILGDTKAPKVSLAGIANGASPNDFGATATPTLQTAAQIATPGGTVAAVDRPNWVYGGTVTSITGANNTAVAAYNGTPNQNGAIADVNLQTGYTPSVVLSSITQITVTDPGVGYTGTVTQCGPAAPLVACGGGGYVPGANQFSIQANNGSVPSTNVLATASLGVVSYTLEAALGGACAGGLAASITTGNTQAVATAILNGSAIGSINLGGSTIGGTGYELSPVVTVTAPIGGGTTATAVAHITGGVVDGVYVLNGGTTYAAADIGAAVTIAAPASGTTATATITAVGGGKVTGISVGTAGTGYKTSPTVTIAGNGTGASAIAVADPNQAGFSGSGVTGIIILSAGSGYTTTPTITISSPTGGVTNATLPNDVALVANTGETIAVPPGSQGVGFGGIPSITLAGADGVAGNLCTAVANLGVVSMAVTQAGAGYTEGATITFNTPTGVKGSTSGVIYTPVATYATSLSGKAKAAVYLSGGTASASVFSSAAVNDTWTLDLPVSFSEPMRTGALTTLTNYTIAANGGSASTDVIPTVTGVTVNNYRSVVLALTLKKTATTSTYSGAWHLNFGTAIADVAGNAIVGLGAASATPSHSTPSYYNRTDTSTSPTTNFGWE